MRWQGQRQSSNVDDRRGRGSTVAVGGGLMTLALVVIVYLLGGDPSVVLNTIQPPQTQSQSGAPYQETAEERQLAEFASVVMAETEDVWGTLFREEGLTYENPTLVLYTGRVQTACGVGTSSTGPFYCPGDHTVNIDLSFFDELKRRFDAPGDFAIAYVIAHEVGHHVQTLLGTTEKVMSLRGRLGQAEFNKYLVRFELQADFYAGVWAHYVGRMDLLEEGDLDEALNAASAVGDDRIQESMQGYVVPDTFTHGTSEQRSYWFYQGYKSGDIRRGDTFNSNSGM